MEERRVASFSIDVFADRANVKEVVSGVLHTIFWYRIFANLQPAYHEVLEVTLPWVQDVNLQTLIEQRVDSLARQIDADSNHQNPEGRVPILVQFSERERKRKKGWFGAKGDDDLIWETWILNVTVVSPRTPQEVSKTRRSVEKSLENATKKITDLVSQNKDHVPPITTQETNTFPYQILVNPRQDLANTRQDGWGQRISLF